MRKLFLAILLVMVVGLPSLSSAELIDRGGGLIYDTVQDITWIQDASYGYNAVGGHQINWYQADAWVNDLQYYDSARNVTWDDWRLPTGDWQILDGHTTLSAGGNIKDELGYLWHIELGNWWGNLGVNVGPFVNTLTYNDKLQHIKYFTSIYTPQLAANQSVGFFWVNGTLCFMQYDYVWGAVWAVRDGDVGAAPVTTPIPAAVWLFGTGLLGLLGIRRKLRT